MNQDLQEMGSISEMGYSLFQAQNEEEPFNDDLIYYRRTTMFVSILKTYSRHFKS